MSLLEKTFNREKMAGMKELKRKALQGDVEGSEMHRAAIKSKEVDFLFSLSKEKGDAGQAGLPL